MNKKVFFVILAMVALAVGCAEPRTLVSTRTGEVMEVFCDGSGKVTKRETVDRGRQEELLRKIGAPEDIIAKVLAGEELSPVDRFKLSNRIKIYNAGDPRRMIDPAILLPYSPESLGAKIRVTKAPERKK